ncbi:dihydroorotate dehydrogenase electron transfer subunit [Clostridium botulinum]|uniref:Dihydroorotate dehydrogenase B (NAD(+)), electron transfer subunit n=1 Tax=Clostridium botulinum TaxID=1491 RepID=A0A6B4UAZ1_CLOBO|nr:dihydroorotate dehydrogenase electron transfer subunit [Clostridium botulinum]KRU27875.1 electron transfer subunit of dihydroorotate dehydrogenase [Clostridium sporogenes]KRU30046.1 electron transfer subunit of dihydroorotate dehydrogenase [Clostridium sporogenes]KRU32383.1 electron transfer subunit of dihydroorotate dehydrogenase [Clostridium sporogenes]KRU45607.1 electron transfer subunit of dihydroorotate dehydrogenase [Clostridium sporogenes]MBZ1330806.1 dihydroorotate dehydrogenase ele
MCKINSKTFKVKVIENKSISTGIFKMTLEGAFKGKPGQFYMIRAWQDEPILWRPISIHDINDNSIEFLYKLEGRGTKILSKIKSEEEVEIMGPLGNGFDLEKIKGKIAIVTGGIGIAPMNYLIKSMKNIDMDIYAGFRDEVYCIEDFNNLVDKVVPVTEDGSSGEKGYVTDYFHPEDYDLVLCCGPEIMMNKVILMCREKKIPLYVSMEKRMACGIGACLVCTCKTKFGNKRTCKDGPVFKGEDILLKGDI